VNTPSWDRAAAVASRLVALDPVGSTNSELARRALASPAADWPHGSVLLTLDQTAGRGRQGRHWIAPAGGSLAASVLLRPAGAPADALGWIPLAAGLAMGEAIVAAAAPAEVLLKWPNDVLLARDGGADPSAARKVCGILAERVGDPGAGLVVVGAGLNLTLTGDALPTAQATSLLEASGREPDADAVLAAFLSGLLDRLAALARAGWDADAGLRAEATAGLATIGRRVRVDLPGGARAVHGTATGLGASGRLIVAEENGATQEYGAGDVAHLRYE